MIRAAPITATALLCTALLYAPSALAAERRVYRIDSVIATFRNGMVSIQARGAVETGGWKNPRLHVVRSDARGIVVEFLAAAPPAGMVVIEALVPVSAIAEVKAHPNAASVNTVAEANEMTTQILR